MCGMKMVGQKGGRVEKQSQPTICNGQPSVLFLDICFVGRRLLVSGWMPLQHYLIVCSLPMRLLLSLGIGAFALLLSFLLCLVQLIEFAVVLHVLIVGRVQVGVCGQVHQIRIDLLLSTLLRGWRHDLLDGHLQGGRVRQGRGETVSSTQGLCTTQAFFLVLPAQGADADRPRH